MINKMFIGYLIGCCIMVVVFIVITLIDATWLSSLIISVLGGLSGFLIGTFGNESEKK